MNECRKMNVQKSLPIKRIVTSRRYLVVCGRRRMPIQMGTLNGILSGQIKFPSGEDGKSEESARVMSDIIRGSRINRKPQFHFQRIRGS